MIRRGWLVLFASLAACGSGEPGTVQPISDTVFDTATTFIAPLPDGTLIVQQDTRLLLLDPLLPDLDSVVVGPIDGVGEFVAAAPISETAIVVLTTDGTFVFRDRAWLPSPLGASLDGPIVAGTYVPTPTGQGIGDVWIATATSLYRVLEEMESVERFSLTEDFSDVQLGVSGRPEGPALWVRLPDRLLEVWRDRTGAVRSAALILEGVPSAIGSDSRPTGWLVLDDRLFSIDAGRQLRDRGFDVQRIASNPASDVFWLWDDAGRVLLHTDDSFFTLEATIAVDTPVTVGVDGALYVGGADVTRLSARHNARLEGPPSGALLAAPTTFRLITSGMPTIEARFGSNDIEPAADGTFQIVPRDLDEGTHELSITLTYADGTLPLVERRSFEVITTASWAEDIQPLYDDHCSLCHGPEGPANTRLDATTDWQDAELFANIVRNVREGRMPLNRPPLSQRQIAFIEAWALAGYPE